MKIVIQLSTPAEIIKQDLVTVTSTEWEISTGSPRLPRTQCSAGQHPHQFAVQRTCDLQQRSWQQTRRSDVQRSRDVPEHGVDVPPGQQAGQYLGTHL